MYKKLPVPLWDTRRIEQYFSDMSKQGYHLVALYNTYAEFEESMPMDYVYKIRPLTKYKKSKLYRMKFIKGEDDLSKVIERTYDFYDMGYLYLGRFLNLFVFRARVQDIKGEVELNDYEKKRMKNLPISNRSFSFMTTLAGVYLGSLLADVLTSGFVYTIVNNPVRMINAVLFTMALIGVIRRLINYSSIKKESGLLTHNTLHWKNKSRRRKIGSLFVYVIFAALLCLPFLQQITYTSYSGEDAIQEVDEQLLRLEDIEDVQSNEEITWEDSRGNKNNVGVSRGILTPVEYDYHEDAVIAETGGGTVNTGSRGGVSCDLDVYYYKFYGSSLAENFYNSVVKESWFIKRFGGNKMESQIFDMVNVSYYKEAKCSAYILLLKENEVWEIYYDGDKNVDEIVVAAQKVYGD